MRFFPLFVFLVCASIAKAEPIRIPQVETTPPTLGPLSAGIQSPAVPTVWTQLTFPLPACQTPPKIDGRIDDPCWVPAGHITGFYRYAGTAPIPSADQTEAWLAADKNHLYLAFHCLVEHPEKIVASQTQRDGDVTRDDYVGLDIDSQNARRNFSSFLVNARGTQQGFLEGGTASNITWAGDWTGAAQRTPDGYTVEMAIPFALMRYPSGTKSFRILLYRQVAGESTLQGWPYVPLAGATNPTEGQYMADFTGIAPPFYTPRPTFLPYSLATAGEGNSVRNGVDIKYPLSTTLTGVASLFPDFETIEQDISTINFSYTPKLLTDNRPFFAEGADFLPENDLFYSRQIRKVDEGLKVVGKNGNTTIGILGTNARSQDKQTVSAFNLRQDFGPLSNMGLEFVSDNETGLKSNRVGRVFGGFGWTGKQDEYTLSGFHTQSYTGGAKTDGSDSLTFQNAQGQNNRPYYVLQYTDLGPNFISDLGYVPETDRRGTSVIVGQTNQYDKGRVAFAQLELDADAYQHHTGGFFHYDTAVNVYVRAKSGWAFDLNPAFDQREQFHDKSLSTQISWGKNTLYQNGSITEVFGREADQHYNFLRLRQGVVISKSFNIQGDYSQLVLGKTHTNLTIITGTYRLNDVRTLGGRIVRQDRNTDLYFSFGQQVRSGADIFVLFGDPNSTRTRGKITLKVVRPF